VPLAFRKVKILLCYLISQHYSVNISIQMLF